MTGSLPLLHGFASRRAVFAWRRGKPVTVDAFLADVDALASRLPASGHVLNVCTDRYRFAVGVAAAIVRGQISLLPPSTHAATVRQLLARFADAYCLTETVQAGIDLPQFINDEADGADEGRVADLPSIAGDQIVAYVFTSGSTGVPTLHRKRWASLVVNVGAEAERLGCAADSPPCAIVATVPPQHMYGFESSVLMAWQSGNAIVAERPFYPADIAAVLDGLPARRLLVTTPFHLRALCDGDIDVPRIDGIVCATAPLSTTRAERAERRTGAPVLEIYGCTETGQIASRRPTVDPLWRPFGDIVLHFEGTRAIASGGHIDEPTPLGDVIEPAADFATTRRFALAGRAADLVNIAGKRTSLGHLDVQLNAIDGVIDGVFVMPEDADPGADADADPDRVTRLAALVVAPTLTANEVLAALRTRIDPVFLPRPLYRVDELPRNATGKLTHAALHDLVAGLRHHRAPEVPTAIRTGSKPFA